jgi:DNA-binding HxlR family transcriptional regulator
MNCSIARALDVVGEWWTLLVVREAFRGVRRFDGFSERLGIAPNILSARLKKLVRHGVLEPRRYAEHPERFEYRLTAKGRQLFPVIIALLTWGDHWYAEDGAPALHLRALRRSARPARDAGRARPRRTRSRAELERLSSANSAYLS